MCYLCFLSSYVVKKKIKPNLISRGFSEKNLSFNKIDDNKIAFITFQFGRSIFSGKVIVELGKIEVNKLLD